MIKKDKIGFDVWRVEIAVHEFISIVKNFELEVYDIQLQQEAILFYAHIWQRYRIYRSFNNIQLVRTTGMLGYVVRSLKKPSRIVSIALSCLLWYMLSHMIFAIDIKGEQKESRHLIQSTLQDMGYELPLYDRDMQMIKQQLKKRLENDIAWLEITKHGSRYQITYTPKEFASLTQWKHEELIAQEDGVIERFDIAHGNKMKKVNDYVHVGDVLVSNVLEDSKGTKEEVFVEGRVYAYTWKDITVTMDQNNLPKSFQYFELLLQARRMVSEDFHKGDTIYKENILQFSKDMGKIKMVIHYTLCKDITTP